MVEHSAAGDVIQHRGEILPLQRLSRRPPTAATVTSEFDVLSIVVYRTAETQWGLLVDRIVDVAPRPIDLRSAELANESDSRHRVIATAVVLGRVTDFLQLN
jgi:chemotaxis signal transduction protein